MMEYEKFLELISDFLDEELDFDIEREFAENFEDECCLYYFNTLRKTVELCREIQLTDIPRELHRKLIEKIECDRVLPCTERTRSSRARRRAKPIAKKIKKG